MKLTHDDFLHVTGANGPGLRKLQHRNQLVLAFGRSCAPTSLTYLPIDAVCLLTTDVLGKTYNLTVASQIMRLRFDQLAHVVGVAEADPSHEAHFCIIDLQRNSDGAQANIAAGASDVVMPELLAADMMEQPELRGFSATRVVSVNVSHLIRFVRAQGAAHGLDLAAAFFPPPDSAEYAELMRPYVERRDAAIIEAKNRRNRATLADRLGDRARAAFEQLDQMQRDREMVS